MEPQDVAGRGLTPGELPAHLPALRRYARRLGAGAEAEDLVQDTLERALTRAPRRIDQPEAYLISTLRNLARDRYRRARVEMAGVDILSLAQRKVAAAEQDTRTYLNEVLRAADDLPEGQAEVLRLVAIEGLDYGEAAEILGLPVGTVTSRLARARAALARRLSHCEA